jgi:cell division protein FtsB
MIVKKLAESLKIKAKKLLGIASWVLAVILLISTVRNINNVRRIQSEVDAERLKVEKMKEDNAQLAAQIAQTQGSAFIEQQIRDKLGLVKPGEAIVVLPDEDIIRASAPEPPIEEDTLPDPNWVRWEKLFF